MSLTDGEVMARLESLREQGYPLSVSSEDAEAFYVCIRRIMDAVPEDDVAILRGDYDLVTSALFHPEPNEFGTSNQRLRSPDQPP